MSPPSPAASTFLVRGIALAVALGIWFAPVPEGLTPKAWHLFAIFGAAILSVILNAFPLLTAAMIALAAAVLTGTVAPAKAFGGFANGSVLLVVVAFLVARGVVKSGLGRRLSYMVVGLFGRSTLGLAYSIFLTDAVIAPAFPSNTARGGVLFPIVLSLAQSGGRVRRTGRGGGWARTSCSAAWRASASLPPSGSRPPPPTPSGWRSAAPSAWASISVPGWSRRRSPRWRRSSSSPSCSTRSSRRR